MIVVTDETNFAEKILGSAQPWAKGYPSLVQPEMNFLASQLFKTEKIFSTIPPIKNNFHCLFVKSYAPDSQFDIIINFLKKYTTLPDRLLLIAGSGSNFHGFKKRAWLAIDGNLHLTVFLKPDQEIEYFQAGFMILAAVSAAQAIDSLKVLKRKAKLRWVNDIMIDEAKVGGVLTYTQSQGSKVTAAVLGIGINVENRPSIISDEFVSRVACLRDFCKFNDEFLIEDIFREVICGLESNYSKLLQGAYEKILDEYLKRSIIIGKEIEIYSDPDQGVPQKISAGRVKAIGKNLELYLEAQSNPVWKGRIIIKK